MTCSFPFLLSHSSPFCPLSLFRKLSKPLKKEHKHKKNTHSYKHTVETNTSKHYSSPTICVQTLCLLVRSAIPLTYHTLLCSSSLWEPSHPLYCLLSFSFHLNTFPFLVFHITNYLNCLSYTIPFPLYLKLYYLPVHQTLNDPSAGSPTDTLLRLLLPLDIKVQILSAVLCMNHKATSTIFTALPNR